MKVRRGYWVAAAWLVWPLVGIVLDYPAHFFLSTSRGCSIEGCDFDFGVLDFLLVFGPPILATAWWWRGRRRKAVSE